MNNMKCQRPGCNGDIVDGFCEECGKAPVGKSMVNETQADSATSVTSSMSFQQQVPPVPIVEADAPAAVRAVGHLRAGRL